MSTKLCHVTSAHPSTDGRIFKKECSSLAKAGYEVYLVARGDSREENGVHVTGLGEPPRGRLARMSGFAAKAVKTALALDCEIYHLHDPELLLFEGRFKRAGKKVIFDSHENHSGQILYRPYFNAFIRRILAGTYAAFEQRTVKKLDAVIIPCTFSGQNPFEKSARLTVQIANYPQKLPLQSVSERSGVCYVGSISAGRGVEQLMHACALCGTRLKLAGAFAGESVRERLMADPDWSFVDYAGLLSHEKTQQLIAGSLVGGCTLLAQGQYSQMDTLPTKAYEYMQNALPVVLSATPYNNECAKKYGFAICVDPEQPEDIARALRELLKDPRRARQMGENGRAAAEKEFIWSSQEEKLLALYAQLLKTK